ncbi:hypothetical protein ACFCXT_14745 [Streptomyces vinaceus]|uniref:hypothetical protein n=1 Tax=Streptomyces vinaceus TaxID=1960 RepID=UPI0035DDB94C
MVTEQVTTADGSVIAATDTWSARVRLPDGSTEHLDTFGDRLAVGAHVVATVDPQQLARARLGPPAGIPGATLITLDVTAAARPPPTAATVNGVAVTAAIVFRAPR